MPAGRIISGVPFRYVPPKSAGSGVPIEATPKKEARESRRSLRSRSLVLLDGWLAEQQMQNEQYFPKPAGQNGNAQLFPSSNRIASSFVEMFGAQGLISYWKLEEASGSRADSYGGNTLTDNNTVTQNPGKLGQAGQFTRVNNEFLSIVDNPSLSVGDIDFTISAWVYLDSSLSGSNRGIVDKVKPAGQPVDVEYLLDGESSSNRFRFAVGDGVSIGKVLADSLGIPATATWYFLIGWHDSVNNTVNIQVNNGTIDSTAWSAGAQDTNAGLFIGDIVGAGTSNWDGRIDSIAFWKRVLSASERGYLYNNGNGRPIIGSEP